MPVTGLQLKKSWIRYWLAGHWTM